MNRAHRLADQVRSVVSWLQRDIGATSTSQFVTKGLLSPTEFVEAGDQLTFQAPTWQWQSCGVAQQVFWLPTDKQYLVTRNIPCRYRIKEWERFLVKGAHSTTDGWTVPGDLPPPGGDVSSSNDDKGQMIQNFWDAPGSDDCDDYVDCGLSTNNENRPRNTLASRTYDLSITYDKYYQSPRLWLFGYDEAGVPLKAEGVFEDIHNDYLAKTVTVDPHPFTGVPTVSIHPCKHAAVMKTVAQNWIKSGIVPRPDLALFILLKMVSSVVPTINYDFTIDVEMPMDEE